MNAADGERRIRSGIVEMLYLHNVPIEEDWPKNNSFIQVKDITSNVELLIVLKIKKTNRKVIGCFYNQTILFLSNKRI